MRFTEKDDFLGYAIPQTNAVGDKQINIALLGKNDNLDEASVTVICQNYIVGEPIRQFGRIEDVLEKHDVGSAEELDLILEGLAKVNQENANLKNELAELKQKAIVPKFKVGQEIYIVCDPNINKIVYGWKIVDYEYYKQQYIVENKDSIDWLREDKIFATLEEAEQKLAEIGEKDD